MVEMYDHIMVVFASAAGLHHIDIVVVIDDLMYKMCFRFIFIELNLRESF